MAKNKNLLLYAGLAGVAYLIYKACCLPQVTQRPVYQPVTSAPTYDHLYQDGHMTEVINKVATTR